MVLITQNVGTFADYTRREAQVVRLDARQIAKCANKTKAQLAFLLSWKYEVATKLLFNRSASMSNRRCSINVNVSFLLLSVQVVTW